VHCCYQNLSTPDYRNLCTYRYRLHAGLLNALQSVRQANTPREVFSVKR
jgi:hypothetical protein